MQMTYVAVTAVAIVVGGAVGYGSVRSELTLQCNVPVDPDAAARRQAAKEIFNQPELPTRGWPRF